MIIYFCPKFLFCHSTEKCIIFRVLNRVVTPMKWYVSFTSTGRGARQDECLREDEQVRGRAEIKRAGSQWCGAQEQLSLPGAEAGDLWSLFCGSPRHGFFVIQVAFPSTSETGTAKLGSSRPRTVKPGSSTRQRLRAVPKVLQARHGARSQGHEAARWVLLRLLVSRCQSRRSLAWLFSTAWTGRYRRGHTEAEALTSALGKWGTVCSLIRNIIFFMVHANLPCFPYKKMPATHAKQPCLISFFKSSFTVTAPIAANNPCPGNKQGSAFWVSAEGLPVSLWLTTGRVILKHTPLVMWFWYSPKSFRLRSRGDLCLQESFWSSMCPRAGQTSAR